MSKLTKALTAAAGNAGESLYAEDVFSTYLYVGNSGVGSTQSNGLDLSGEGGLVWIKNRDNASANHSLFDTERGGTKVLYSNGTSSEQTGTDGISFLSNGWSTAPNGVYDLNSSGADYASWSFRKAEKFFDVVTYTGNGTTQNISHNLGSTPAVIIVKNTQSSTFWAVYHKDVPNFVGFLNATNAFDTSNTQNFGNNTNPVAPTDSVFTVGQQSTVNSSGETYVAYLFASDAGGFGDDGSENIIKCGSFTTDGSGLFSVTLGFEPQWILAKRTSGTDNWRILDAMRGLTASGAADALLSPNTSSAEIDAPWFGPTPTGFEATSNNLDYNSDYIYIAIRRPMKTPESGTEVFTPNSYSGNSAADRTLVSSNSPVDLGIVKKFNGNGDWLWSDRLRGAGQTLYSNYTQAESVANPPVYITGFDLEDGMEVGSHLAVNASGNNYISYMFTRATGFFDVVAYTGNGVAGHTLNHNLGVVPELMIVKRRNDTEGWQVYHKDLDVDEFLEFDTGSVKTATGNFSRWNNTRPTDSVFTVGGTWDAINASGSTYINYLFASVAGVSKVGSYTGTGSNVDVDCGFSAGARFILIKRTDSTGDWYVWDTERGIVAGNDPYVLINSQSGEVTSTDYIDPLSSGFTVTSSAPAALNASGGTYIFLAIA